MITIGCIVNFIDRNTRMRGLVFDINNLAHIVVLGDPSIHKIPLENCELFKSQSSYVKLCSSR
jgi:hypothetical protein